MTDTTPPLGTIIQRKDGMFIGTYMNRRALSMDENRILAYLQTIKLEEEGLLQGDAVAQAKVLYPYPATAQIQILWDTVQPATKLVAGAAPDSEQAKVAKEEANKQAKPNIQKGNKWQQK